MHLTVVGGGLAGSEAAWQAAERGLDVSLFEMRPDVGTAAHETSYLAELVCSNSLGSNLVHTGGGLLKEELRRLGSLVMRCADAHSVPAGRALAVDRRAFASAVTEAISGHPRIEVVRKEVKGIPEGPAVIATGPLTSGSLAGAIAEAAGRDYLYFYDAAAPIITQESLTKGEFFTGSRYEEGEDDYINCPLNKEQYETFWEALVAAEVVPLEGPDRMVVFEGCMPVEEIARRGKETLRFGPMKPVGLTDPRTGRWPYAVVQLRREDRAGVLYNLVGFQTRLKWGEQKRVFGMIPALAEAEFVRYGVMHRNTFLDAPSALHPTYESRDRQGLFFAGQITGVEGYLESTASGLMAGVNAANYVRGLPQLVAPPETMTGALARYITTPRESVQPMNANFGIVPPIPGKHPRQEKRTLMAERGLTALLDWVQTVDNCMKIAK